jgi:hypothetical protein
VRGKTRLAHRHLQRTRAEHERLITEIDALRAEVEAAERGGEPATDELGDEADAPPPPRPTPPQP